MAAYSNGITITSSPRRSREESTSPNQSNGDIQSSLVYNQSQKGRHYGTVYRGKNGNSTTIIHAILPTDTLQGIALKYGVPVSDIQRANQLLGNETIHKYKELKIPVSTSPNTSPTLRQRETKTKSEVSQSQSIEGEGKEEEEVKRKPPSLSNTGGGERDIMSLLTAVDKQLVVSKSFADKLADKNSALTLPPDAYNRTHPVKEELTEQYHDEDTLSDKLKRTFKRTTKWSPAKDSEEREKVEDELFQL